MFNWLRQKVHNKGVDMRRQELENFLIMLKGMDDEELGLVVLYTSMARNLLETFPERYGFLRGFSLHEPHLSVMQDPECFVKVRKIIAMLQKDGNNEAAAGYMPWLHTLRAADSPEIRYAARQMWAELARGFDHVGHWASLMNTSFSAYFGYDEFPEGFEP